MLSSERVASLGWPEEVFYRRLMSIVDDYGRHEANQQLLRAKCYPLQTDSVRVADIARWMAACQKSGLILVYGVNGKQYLEIANFGQQLRSASKCPAPDDSGCEQMISDAHLGVSVSVAVSECGKAPARKGKAKEQTLPDWLASLPDDALAVPADDPVFEWAGKVGLPREWIALAWWAFEARYESDAKTYRDWRAVFRRAVREDWLRLWRTNRRDGGWELTTTGEQVRLEMTE
jgi:hypothetical protein